MSGLRIGSDLTLPLDVLTEAVGIIATRGAGKTYGSVVLLEEAHDASVQFAVIDPTGVYHGLRSSADGKRDGLPVYVIGGPHGDLPLEAASGSFLADLVVDSGHSFVFDLSDLSKTKARSWVAAFLERLYERKARDRTTFLLVVDEADEFAPQKARGESAVVLGAMEQVVKRGRSRGIGVILISQRTQAINKDVLDLIDTLIALRVVAPRGRAAIADWVIAKEAEDEKGVVASLNSLPTGCGWLWSPVRGTLKQFTFRRIRTFDSYATPKPGETRVEPAKRKEIDLDALGEQMRSTIERAKENDPTQLRKRVHDLERQLASSDTPRARDEAFLQVKADLERRIAELEAREPERIEVPILSDDQIGRLADLAKELREAAGSASESAGEITRTLEESKATARVETVERREEARSAAAPTRRPPARPPSPPTPLPAAALNGHALSSSQQKILDALAWFEEVGVAAPRKPPLAAVAGVSSKSSGFRANISTLSSRGLVTYPHPGRVALTETGREQARPPAYMGTPSELQEAVYRMVSGPQADLLRVLVDAYPAPLDRETLAERAGVSPLSSGFRANVSTLSGFELLTYPEPGLVKASPLLFLEETAPYAA